jgi:hypothetical protein
MKNKYGIKDSREKNKGKSKTGKQRKNGKR